MAAGQLPAPLRPIDYAEAVKNVQYQDSRRWQLVNAYFVVQGLLVGALFAKGVRATDPLAALVALTGAIVSLIWYYFIHRNNWYLQRATAVVGLLERGIVEEHRMFTERPAGIKARHLLYAIIATTGLLWFVWFVVTLSIIIRPY
ncbi:MAG: hypothetical protein QOE90_572 [Thermoplasmata archaeon]|jgi:hypothetical protein|nr:hypothetical protein [Thermoplasmata archaeon]